MNSYPRPVRPAATDYFSPAQQTELLQNIKAKVERSATSTPQEQSDNLSNAHKTVPYGGVKTVDFKAHELSLREKLEKAKADREAKAKAEAAMRENSQPPQHLDTAHRTNENTSTEPFNTNGPPPPSIQNNTTTPMQTPMPPAYGPGWTPGVPFQHPSMPNYQRPPYPQYPYPQQYAMPPYANGQPPVQGYPQWNQYPQPQPTPGVPPPPNHSNQGSPSNQGLPSQGPPSQGPVTQAIPNQKPPQPEPQYRVGLTQYFPQAPNPPQYPQHQQTPAQQSSAPAGIPPRPGIPHPIQSQGIAFQRPTPTPQLVSAQPAAPIQLPSNIPAQSAAPAQSEVQGSSLASAPKGPAGSMYNSAPLAAKGTPTLSLSTSNPDVRSPLLQSQPLNGEKQESPVGIRPPRSDSPPQSDSTPRRPTSPYHDARRFDESPSRHRHLPPTGPSYRKDFGQHSPATQHPVARYPSEHINDYASPREHPPPSVATRITTPSSRMSYRDRSRSPPRRTPSLDRRPRPTIPEEGYKRENWDPNRGGYRKPPPSRQDEEERRFSQLPRRPSPPSIARFPPRRDSDVYYPPPMPSRDYRPYGEYPPNPVPRTRSRSPPIDYPPPHFYFDIPPRHIPPRDFPPYRPISMDMPYRSPPPPIYRDDFDEIYPLPPPEYPPYEKNFRAPPLPMEFTSGYRDFRDEREIMRPPNHRGYSPSERTRTMSSRGRH